MPFSALVWRRSDSNKFHTTAPKHRCGATLTDLVVSVAFMLRRIRLAQFILELSVQIILCVHNIQVFVLVPVPFIFLVLAGAADVIKHLPQLVTLGWPCERRHRDILHFKNDKNTHKDKRRAWQSGLVGIWSGSQSGEHRQQLNTPEDAPAATTVWAVMASGEAATVAVVHYWRNIHNNGICWDMWALVSKQIRCLEGKHEHLADEWRKRTLSVGRSFCFVQAVEVGAATVVGKCTGMWPAMLQQCSHVCMNNLKYVWLRDFVLEHARTKYAKICQIA